MRRNIRNVYWNHLDTHDYNKHVLPFQELTEFKTDSMDIDTGATLMKIEEDDKCYTIKYYNQNGIVSTFKKRKSKKS